MSYFASKLFGLSSGSTASDTNANKAGASSISGAETIERLCDRLQSSRLIDDRRESLQTIKSLSSKYKLEVGTQAMSVLIDVLRTNRTDTELCALALDTLYNVVTNLSEDKEYNLPADISTQFTEMFIKQQANNELIFDMFDEFDFQIRLKSVKLLNSLISNQCEQLQNIILLIPRGVSRLMDLLNDSREIIRNETILLLINLTKTNANIQKIVAFESGFDRIMEIIESEGGIDGGVIVEDCLTLLLNLLQTNNSNQSFFKEANYVKQVCKYLDIHSASNELEWSEQKTRNLSLLLKVMRCLVAPSNQQQIINDCQKAYNQCGLLHRLCAILMLPGLPTEQLSEAIATVGEVIRGNQSNQQLFSTVMMQSTPPRAIVLILLMSMTNEKQPFHLRCAILYCFECFLFKNEEKKSEVIATLLPKHANAAESQLINAGQILCSGLFNLNDAVSNWLCAVALLHTINESNVLKEQLLKVQLAINNLAGNVQPVTLLQQCMNILLDNQRVPASASNATVSRNIKFQSVVSILMFISGWLANCPNAVDQFLANDQNIPYLISQVSATDTEEKSLIIQGLSAFVLGLTMLFNNNQTEIEKLKDTIRKRIGIEQFQDKLEFISQHDSYTKTLKKSTFAFKHKQAADLLFDYEFTRLFKSNETLILNLLSAKNEPVSKVPSQMSSLAPQSAHQAYQIDQQSIISKYQQIIREQDDKLKEQFALNQVLSQTCAQLQESVQSLNDKVLHSSVGQANELNNAERLQLQARINELEVKSNLLEEKCSEQEDEICKLQREKGTCQETINNLKTLDKSTESIELRVQNEQLRNDYKQLSDEQENLLILLQEMEEKLRKYKTICKQLGGSVSDDEDHNDNNDDEESQEAQAKSLLNENKHVEHQQSNGDKSEPNTAEHNGHLSSLMTKTTYDDFEHGSVINSISLLNNTSSSSSDNHSAAHYVNDSQNTSSSSNSNSTSSYYQNMPPSVGLNFTNLNLNSQQQNAAPSQPSTTNYSHVNHLFYAQQQPQQQEQQLSHNQAPPHHPSQYNYYPTLNNYFQ